MIYFVGAGPGAVDLITVRGKKLLQTADQIIYAGSLVNPLLLQYAKKNCEIHNSASMTLEDVIECFTNAEKKNWLTVRLHTGDPSIYGAIREQIDILKAHNIPFQVVPGVSSFQAAAALLNAEYTLPAVSQTLIITRAEGRTEMPEKENLSALASHGSSMAVFLSASLIEKVKDDILKGGVLPETKAAIVYKASWQEEKKIIGTVGTLDAMQKELGTDKTALILVGNFLGDSYERSKLYDPAFTHAFRNGA